MMNCVIAVLALCLAAIPVSAQMQPDAQSNALIQNVSEAFFDLIQKEDFATERAFLTDELAYQLSEADWRKTRRKVIEATGPTPRFRAHGVTYYQQAHLLAAVDYSAQAAKPNTFICGYLLWELPSPGAIGLSRFEQNVVDVGVFRAMPPQEAAQLMAAWRCPVGVIETVLGITAN